MISLTDGVWSLNYESRTPLHSYKHYIPVCQRCDILQRGTRSAARVRNDGRAECRRLKTDRPTDRLYPFNYHSTRSVNQRGDGRQTRLTGGKIHGRTSASRTRWPLITVQTTYATRKRTVNNGKSRVCKHTALSVRLFTLVSTHAYAM